MCFIAFFDMDFKLIADAGSTKVDWTVLDSEGKIVRRHTSDGMNALLASLDEVMSALENVRDLSGDINIFKEIHYYGAGCATPEICDKMKAAISSTWDAGYVAVTSDLLAAARALFGNRSGIACILGTGSNSCLYDGNEIVKNVPSLGFILGDEGSGAALGKRLVADSMKGMLPDSIKQKFLDSYSLSLADILEKVYKSSHPNKFLASLVPFIADNLWNPYIYSLVLTELTNFVKRNVAMYPGAHSMKVSFTGSIAYNFQNILREAVSSQGYKVSEITPGPMDGLIKFHSENNYI